MLGGNLGSLLYGDVFVMYGSSEERCVGKFRIYIRHARMIEVYDKLANFQVDALSSDNKYSIKVASAKRRQSNLPSTRRQSVPYVCLNHVLNIDAALQTR